MPTPIKPKRSFTANAVPTATDIHSPGELLINWADAKAFTKDSSGNVISVTLGGSGGGGSGSGSGLAWSSVPASATSSGTAGQIAYDGSYFYLATGANAWKRTAVAAWEVDSFFSSVSLLLHMDGSGSAFVDNSGLPKTITAYGDATQTTAQSKFGGKSAAFDGNGDYLQTPTYNVPALQFNTVQHTVEFWFRTTSTQQYTCLFYKGTTSESQYDYVININNSSASSGDIFLFSLGFNNAAMGTTQGGYNDGNWHHLAVVRDSADMFRMYVDGIQRATRTENMTEAWSNSATSIIRIGKDGALSGRDLAGHIDDLRITKGVCRYPSGTTFSPPAAAFPDS